MPSIEGKNDGESNGMCIGDINQKRYPLIESSHDMRIGDAYKSEEISIDWILVWYEVLGEVRPSFVLWAELKC